MLLNSIDAFLLQIFVQAQDALEAVVVIVDVGLINKDFFGFIILFTFQAQDALEEEERRTFRKEQRTNILQGQVGLPLYLLHIILLIEIEMATPVHSIGLTILLELIALMHRRRGGTILRFLTTI